jgi:hypothetical protein
VCHATNRIHSQYRQRRILECHQPAASPQHRASSRGDSKLQGPRFAQFLWFLAHFEIEGFDDAIELPNVVIRCRRGSLHRTCVGVRRDADGKPGRESASAAFWLGFRTFHCFQQPFGLGLGEASAARAVSGGRGAGEDCVCYSVYIPPSYSSIIVNLTHNVDQLPGSCLRNFPASAAQKCSIASRFAASRLVAPAGDLPAETDSTTVVPYYLDETRHCRVLGTTEV